jgi:hypothetical protein
LYKPALKMMLLSDQQRIAIGRRIDYRLRTDNGPGARPVFHCHVLPKPFRQLVRQQAADHVISASRRARHHDLDGMVGVALRRHAAGRQCQKRQRERAGQTVDSTSLSAIKISLCAAVVILAAKLAVQVPD